MLGRALASSGPPNVELIAVSHEQLDITRSDAVASTLNTLRPHIVINASGFTAVDRAETERAEAFAVNATAVAELGSAPVVGMPTCGMAAKATTLDLVLPRIFAGDRLTLKELSRLGDGGLFSAESSHVLPPYRPGVPRGELGPP